MIGVSDSRREARGKGASSTVDRCLHCRAVMMRMVLGAAALGLLMVGVSCEGGDPVGASDEPLGSGSAGTGGPFIPGAGGMTPLLPSLDRCVAATAAIAAEAAGQEVCTFLVRVDAKSLEVRAHSKVCGSSAPIDEATARGLASQASILPGGATPSYELIGGTPEDAWVYMVRWGDFGGLAAVSPKSGLVTFRARWDWLWTEDSLRSGPVIAPASWSQSDLGAGCAAPPSVRVQTFDLREEGKTTPPKSGEDAARMVLSTALPGGLAELGGVRNVVTLLFANYSGTVPIPLEYVVLVNAAKAP
jgi:hypothetical protein